MEKFLFAFLVCCVLGWPLHAQENNKPPSIYNNAVSYEFIGHGRSLICLNYERTIYRLKDFLYVGLRGGISYSPGNKGDKNYSNSYDYHATLGIPIVLSSYLGRRHSRVSFGLGYTGLFDKAGVDYGVYPPRVFQKYESAMVLRIGYMYKFTDYKAYFEIYPLYLYTDNPSQFLKHQYSVGFTLGISF